MQAEIKALARVKHIIDRLRAVNQAGLTQTERQAIEDVLDQAYERAAYFAPQVTQLLEQGNKERLAPSIESHFFV